MARVRIAVLAVSLGWAAPAAADPLDRWSALIAEASSRFGVPVDWIRRVMRAESGGRPTLDGRPTVSRAGAMGLMQLMPGTWREMRAALALGSDPHDPRDNIFAGTFYLRLMHDRFGYPGLFGAYNAGPARYSRHLATGRRLPAETIAYVAAVSRGGGASPQAPAAPPARPELFVLRRAGGTLAIGAPPPAAMPDPRRLFVSLHRFGAR